MFTRQSSEDSERPKYHNLIRKTLPPRLDLPPLKAHLSVEVDAPEDRGEEQNETRPGAERPHPAQRIQMLCPILVAVIHAGKPVEIAQHVVLGVDRQIGRPVVA